MRKRWSRPPHQNLDTCRRWPPLSVLLFGPAVDNATELAPAAPNAAGGIQTDRRPTREELLVGSRILAAQHLLIKVYIKDKYCASVLKV